MKKDAIVLDFESAITDELLDKNIRDGISSVAKTDNYLWIVGDENISIQRLELLGDGSYGNSVNFFLTDFIELPSHEDEADIEGLDVSGNYLWIVGSHSYKRKKIDENSDDPHKSIDRLCQTKLGPNRNLLARIPIIKNENGEYVLKKKCQDPENPDKKLTAAKLAHTKKWSHLTKKLKKDNHLGRFITMPGKDNGFDIEGLAVSGDKLFLGLRGPVLRGWAIILEIQLKEKKKGLLKLKKDKSSDTYYKKHFLNLHGMGIRELARDGDDLIILAGPTMDLDGSMEVYRWKNGTLHEGNQLVKRNDIESILALPYKSKLHGVNKAEGIVLLDNHSILVVYDSPSKEKTIGEFKVKADVFSLNGQAE